MAPIHSQFVHGTGQWWAQWRRKNVKRARNKTVGRHHVLAARFPGKIGTSPPSCHPATSCLCATRWMGRIWESFNKNWRLLGVPVSHVGWSDRIISNRRLYFAVAHVQTINLFSWPFKTVPAFLNVTSSIVILLGSPNDNLFKNFSGSNSEPRCAKFVHSVIYCKSISNPMLTNCQPWPWAGPS